MVPYWSISGFHFLQEVHRCLQHYPRIPHHQLNAIPALGKPRHRVSLIDDGQRRSVVLPFLAQFCRQLRIRSSCKLLNAADWTFYASKIKTTLLAYPSFKDIFCRKAGIIVRITFCKFLFHFFEKDITQHLLSTWKNLMQVNIPS